MVKVASGNREWQLGILVAVSHFIFSFVNTIRQEDHYLLSDDFDSCALFAFDARVLQ